MSAVEKTVSECPLPRLRVSSNLLTDPIGFQETLQEQTKPATTTVKKEEKWDILKKSKDSISVRGKTKENRLFWKDTLKSSVFVQNIMHYGYIIFFISNSPHFYAKKNKSSLNNSRFVSYAILKLLKNNFIEKLRQKPWCTANQWTG